MSTFPHPFWLKTTIEACVCAGETTIEAMSSSHSDKDEAMAQWADGETSPTKKLRAAEGAQAEKGEEAQGEKAPCSFLETATKKLSLQDGKAPTNEDVRMDQGSFLETVSMRLMYMERRGMLQNILPHEVMRQVMAGLQEFNHRTGETDWITRTLSDLRLSLHMRYLQISVSPDDCRKAAEVVFTESLRMILMEAWHKDEKMG